MYRRILVPLDGSARAERIMTHVEELAHRFEAEVILLQMVEPEPLSFGPHGSVPELAQDLTQQRIQEAETYLAGWQGEFREKGIRTRKVVEYGHVVSGIIAVAQREDVDLIAMASHGRGGLTRVFYGSVAAGILQRIDRPLLLIRARTD